MASGHPVNMWARPVSDNNGSNNKKKALLEIVLQQSEAPKYGNLSKIELAAVRAIHKYDPAAKGHGPNGPLFDDILNSLVPGVANISRPELYDVLTGLIDAKYISIDPLNSTYSLMDRGKNIL